MKVTGGRVMKTRNGVGADSWACTTTLSRMRIPATFHHTATRGRRGKHRHAMSGAVSPTRMSTLRPSKVMMAGMAPTTKSCQRMSSITTRKAWG